MSTTIVALLGGIVIGGVLIALLSPYYYKLIEKMYGKAEAKEAEIQKVVEEKAAEVIKKVEDEVKEHIK